MAKFYAISETDIVGSLEHLTFPPPYVLTVANIVVTDFEGALTPGTKYTIFNFDAALSPAANLTSFANFSVPATGFVTFGAGPTNHVWKADSGDSYLYGTPGIASTDTLAGLILTAQSGVPTKTHGTEQQINQFFFKFEDKIHGSDEDDMLCGWAEDDMLWGGEGNDEFYYGEGMGKDKIMDFNKNDDEVILDTDLVQNFKKLKPDVKFKSEKVVLNFGGGDKLIIYDDISNFKQLKNVVAFDDFTDFS